MENILLPNKITINPGKGKNEAIFIVEPCYQGYGTTLGNALRRVLLSSLPGAACYAVKIKGAQHEFSTMPGIKEDVLQLILNLKQLRLKVFTDEPVKLRLSAKGVGVVKAKDIDKNSDVEIISHDLHLAQLTDKNAVLEMDIYVNRGRGYTPIEERDKSGLEIGAIAIDAIYTPVRSVGFKVENTRVGDITNYDKLILTLETDGTITPEEAIDQSIKILIDHFLVLESRGVPAIVKPEVEPEKEAVEETKENEIVKETEEKKVKKVAKKAKKK
jgi:DNA-directed RNA polymerase subunit alpha